MSEILELHFKKLLLLSPHPVFVIRRQALWALVMK